MMNRFLDKAAAAVRGFPHTQDYKQVILIRHDLKLPKGKMAAQAAHASVEALFKADHGIVAKWRGTGMMKAVLKAKDDHELLQLYDAAQRAGLPSSLITDAGRTVVEPGTMTACGIGPAAAAAIDKITQHLPLM